MNYHFLQEYQTLPQLIHSGAWISQKKKMILVEVDLTHEMSIAMLIEMW